jgi:hypothetical protein
MAAQLDKIEALEVTAREAKAVYQSDRENPALREAHRAASQALNDARSAVRSTGVVIGGDAVKEG